MGNFKTIHINRFFSLVFFLVLVMFWRFYYVNHLVQKEQMQLFLFSWDYFIQHLLQQGGLAIYLGEFITQFFLNKWGAAVLVACVLVQTVWATQKVFGKLFGNQTFSLSFLPAIGYTFVLFNSSFEFSGAVAVVLSIWSVYACLQIGKPQKRLIISLVFLVVNYWFFGGSYILFTTSIILIEFILYKNKNEQLLPQRSVFWVALFYLVLGIFMPFTCYKFLLTDHLLSSYMSRAYYQLSSIFPSVLVLLFLSVPILLLYHGFIQNRFNKKVQQWLNVGFAIVLGGFLVGGLAVFPDFEEEREMHFDNLVAEQKWENIIELAEQDAPKGKKGKLALSLALGKTVQMSKKLFQFNPRENDFFISFNFQGQAPIIANEPYFYLGLNNFSKMSCFETMESTPNEKLPVRAVKRLVETFIIDGQYAIAKRYLGYLQQSLFYRKWAKNAQAYLFNDVKVEQHPRWGKLRNFKTNDDFYYQYERNDVALLTLLRSNQQNTLAYEYLMSWYLLQKDFDEFLKYLPLAEKMGYNQLPLVFQEALAYVSTLLDELPASLSRYKISSEVKNQLNRYAKAFQQGGSQKPAEMKKQFGNTYWYYVHFTETKND